MMRFMKSVRKGTSCCIREHTSDKVLVLSKSMKMRTHRATALRTCCAERTRAMQLAACV